MIQRILRVDHAGEHGAIAIYSAQLARARARYPDLVPWLEETLSHEKRHRERFQSAMDERAITPCGALVVWSTGGAALGAMTAMLGREGVYVCTAAVERTVRRHLIEQGAYLESREPALAALVRDILVEEDEHLAHAAARHDSSGALAHTIGAIVSGSTELLIWLSTQGATFGFRRDLA